MERITLEVYLKRRTEVFKVGFLLNNPYLMCMKCFLASVLLLL